jgi:hypothetical protein
MKRGDIGDITPFHLFPSQEKGVMVDDSTEFPAGAGPALLA